MNTEIPILPLLSIVLPINLKNICPYFPINNYRQLRFFRGYHFVVLQDYQNFRTFIEVGVQEGTEGRSRFRGNGPCVGVLRNAKD